MRKKASVASQHVYLNSEEAYLGSDSRWWRRMDSNYLAMNKIVDTPK
jgi:hypothetical protein